MDYEDEFAQQFKTLSAKAELKVDKTRKNLAITNTKSFRSHFLPGQFSLIVVVILWKINRLASMLKIRTKHSSSILKFWGSLKN